MTIEMTSVQSGLISYAGYEEDKKALLLEFCRGPAHLYDDVPKDVFEALMSAEATDDYFNANIRYTYKNKRVG